jgi:hypothetical protein
VDRQKSEEIALGDAHQTIEPVSRQSTGGNPAANSPARDRQSLSDLLDGVEARERLRRAVAHARRGHNSHLIPYRVRTFLALLTPGLHGGQRLAAAVEPNVWEFAHSSTSATR